MIAPAPEAPEGYVFLGWARVPTTVSESADGTPPTANILNLGEDDIYLKYEDGIFTVQGDPTYNGTRVSHVAADERLDYHDMYAVWRKLPTLRVVKVDENDPSLYLSGSAFTLNEHGSGQIGDTIYPTDGTNNEPIGAIVTLPASNCEMTLTETQAPDGYIILNNSITLYKHGNQLYLTHENNSYSNPVPADAYGSDANGYADYMIVVPNTPGVALPNAGGPGTDLFLALGTTLTLGAALVIFRKKIV